MIRIVVAFSRIQVSRKVISFQGTLLGTVNFDLARLVLNKVVSPLLPLIRDFRLILGLIVFKT